MHLHRRRRIPMAAVTLAVAVAVATAGGCGTSRDEPRTSGEGSAVMDAERHEEPERITVDHILIAVSNPRMPTINRTQEAAERLAETILEELRNGGDWNALKERYSDDRGGPGQPAGGPYAMANNGTTPANENEFPRSGMVPAFGNVGFHLAAGEVGVAHFHEAESPYGVHLILRIN